MKRTYRNNLYRGSVTSPFQSGLQVGSRYIETFQFDTALVLDVVTNDAHPDYDVDGYNVGTIKFRFLETQENRPEESLNVAFPLDPNITRYPLLNEIVLVFQSLNRYYYIGPFNTTNRPSSQAIFGIADELAEQPSSGDTARSYDENAAGGAPKKQNPAAQQNRLGEVFVDKPGVFRLRPQEGDVFLEGRSGHSLRLGANFDRQQAPNLLIRVGPNPTPDKSVDSPFALVNENIDKDLSSVWLVTDQIVPLTFATVNDASHFKSVSEKPSLLDGNQIVVNTDRLVINTKQDALLVSTFLGTHFTTLGDHTVDAAKTYRSYAAQNREISVGTDYLLDVGGKTEHVSQNTHAIVGSKVFIGSKNDESEPLVLGEELRKLLLEFVDAHLSHAAAYTLPTVGIGPLAPGTISALQRVKAKLTSSKQAPFESRDNFTVKTNTE